MGRRTTIEVPVSSAVLVNSMTRRAQGGRQYACDVDSSEHAVLVYDGDCGFCSVAAAWITTKWKKPKAPEAVPAQRLGEVDLEHLGLTADDVKMASWWVEDGRKSRGHLAIARALIAAGTGWRLIGQLLLLPPVRWLAAIGYRIVSRFRYRLPG